MTAPIKPLLDDLLLDAAHLQADPVAAWARGRRRRAGTRLAATAAAVAGSIAVVTAIAAGAGVLPHASEARPAGTTGPGSVVGGYPERIEHGYGVDDLPDAPGPVAGLLDQPDGRWLAVTATGQVWRLPDQDPAAGVRPSLSDDGTHLAYQTFDGYVVRDLTTGTIVHPDVRPAPGRAAYWSPDDTSVVLLAAGEPKVADLVGVDASVTPVDVRAPGTWRPAGWVRDDLVWVRETPRATGLVVTDRQGATVRRASFDGSRPVLGSGAWTPWVTPDGVRIVLVTPDDRGDVAGGSSLVTTYDVGDGAARSAIPSTSALERCRPGWQGGQVTYPAVDETDPAVLLRGTDGGAEVVAYPGLDVRCVTWAADALDGVRHQDLAAHVLGTSTAGPTWWWREIVAATGLLLLALLTPVVALRVTRVRRRRRTSGA